MRHLLLSIALLLSLSAGAQFHATPDGIKAENGKDYIVVEYPDKTAEQLYKAVEAYIMANYVNPKNVMSGQEYTMINLRTLYKQAFQHKSMMGIKYYADITTSTVFRFKDGKLRMDAPTVVSMWGVLTGMAGGIGELYYPDLFYKKNGKVKDEGRLANFNAWLTVTTSVMLKQIDDEVKGSVSSTATDEDW